MIALSHSSIQLYLDCPQKWKFKYVDKIPEKPRHFFSFGKSAHAALEYLYDVKTLPPPTLEAVLKFYEDNWISEGYESPEQEADYKRQGEQIIRDYYAKHIGSFKIPYFTEYGFAIDVDGVKVRGFVDRIDKVGDSSIAIIDYKTGKSIPLSRVQRDSQLTMYQMACEQLLGLKVESLIFYHLPSQTELKAAPHSQDMVKSLRGQIVEVAKQISDAIYTPKPEERKCGWCDYKQFCPAWKHEYAAQAPQSPAEAPALKDDAKLAKLVDRYGKMKDDIHEREAEADEIKERIVAALKAKGYVRAFGSSYQVSCHEDEKWEFSDKDRVLETIKNAGFWDKIVSPTIVRVQTLMKDPNIPLDLRDRLQRLGKKVVQATLRVRKVEEAD